MITCDIHNFNKFNRELCPKPEETLLLRKAREIGRKR